MDSGNGSIGKMLGIIQANEILAHSFKADTLERHINLKGLAELTPNYTGAGIEVVVKSYHAFAMRAAIDLETMKPLGNDNIKVSGEYFMSELQAVRPAFRIEENLLERYARDCILEFWDEFQATRREVVQCVDAFLHSEHFSLMTFCVHSQSGIGSTSLAVEMASEGFRHLKMMTAKQFIGNRRISHHLASCRPRRRWLARKPGRCISTNRAAAHFMVTYYTILLETRPRAIMRCHCIRKSDTWPSTKITRSMALWAVLWGSSHRLVSTTERTAYGIGSGHAIPPDSWRPRKHDIEKIHVRPAALLPMPPSWLIYLIGPILFDSPQSTRPFRPVLIYSSESTYLNRPVLLNPVVMALSELLAKLFSIASTAQPPPNPP
jgi:hypothetical protein